MSGILFRGIVEWDEFGDIFKGLHYLIGQWDVIEGD